MDDYRVKGVGPDMTEQAFLDVLKGANSPVTPDEARNVYRYCLARKVSAAFILAMFHHESSFGKAGSAVTTRSWGNTRPPSVPPISVGVTDRTFSMYRDWSDGGFSTVARLVDYPPYFGKDTVREVIPTWAPSSDGNNTERYIQAVLTDIAQWAVVIPVASSPFFVFWRGLWTSA